MALEEDAVAVSPVGADGSALQLPLEALRIYSANGAQFLGESDRIGTLAQGKAANLIVIHGDPSKNISDIEKTEIVFKDGVGFDSAKLIESVRGSVGLH